MVPMLTVDAIDTSPLTSSLAVGVAELIPSLPLSVNLAVSVLVPETSR